MQQVKDNIRDGEAAKEKETFPPIPPYREKENRNNIWISATSITNDDLKPYTSYPTIGDNITYFGNSITL